MEIIADASGHEGARDTSNAGGFVKTRSRFGKEKALELKVLKWEKVRGHFLEIIKTE